MTDRQPRPRRKLEARLRSIFAELKTSGQIADDLGKPRQYIHQIARNTHGFTLDIGDREFSFFWPEDVDAIKAHIAKYGRAKP